VNDPTAASARAPAEQTRPTTESTFPSAGRTQIAPAESHADELSTRGILEAVQAVLTALILAFIFRAFFIEAFIIPTGSMAESLLGEHGALVCPSCGWEYDFGPTYAGASPGEGFRGGIVARCPNCHQTADLAEDQIRPRDGDRVLVHKWPFVIGRWLAPQRWDVIVFRDPADPGQNFIKRVIGLPHEEIEIIDGDIYIRAAADPGFAIARKTPAAQEVLWRVVWDQRHVLPLRDDAAIPSPWVTLDGPPSAGIGWSGADTRVLRYDTADSTERTLAFEPAGSRYYFHDVCGYNRGASGSADGSVIVGDIRLRAELSLDPSHGGQVVRVEITRDDHWFALEIDRPGDRMRMLHRAPGEPRPVEWASCKLPAALSARPVALEFGHLDYRVYACFDGRDLLQSTDAQYAPDLPRLRSSTRVAAPTVRLVASGGSLELRDLRIDRDVHYLSRGSQRAQPDEPFALRADEYFVLGDNSASSHDSREWTRVGPHLRQARATAYRPGTVPADQIVGRAFFVYLPGLVPAEPLNSIRLPDVGRMRMIR